MTTTLLAAFLLLSDAGLTRGVTADGTVYWSGGPRRPQKTIVLLHGANESSSTWSAVVPELRKKHHLIVPDLPGHGESEPKSGPLPLSMIVAQLHAVIEKEAPGKKVVLAGNSMGGWVSMLYAFAHRDRVESLVLEDASGMMWDLTGVPLFPKNREEARAMMRAVNGPGDRTPDERLDEFLKRRADLPMGRVTEIFESLVDSRLTQLTMPVTLIWGRHDGILSLAYAEALQKKIPGAKLEIIEGAAHIPHRQQPAKFVKCLTATF